MAPIIVTLVGGVFALRTQSEKWIVHLCVFGCLFATLPAFIYLWGLVDRPAANEPTNAFMAVTYLMAAVLTGLHIRF